MLSPPTKNVSQYLRKYSHLASNFASTCPELAELVVSEFVDFSDFVDFVDFAVAAAHCKFMCEPEFAIDAGMVFE